MPEVYALPGVRGRQRFGSPQRDEFNIGAPRSMDQAMSESPSRQPARTPQTRHVSKVLYKSQLETFGRSEKPSSHLRQPCLVKFCTNLDKWRDDCAASPRRAIPPLGIQISAAIIRPPAALSVRHAQSPHWDGPPHQRSQTSRRARCDHPRSASLEQFPLQAFHPYEGTGRAA